MLEGETGHKPRGGFPRTPEKWREEAKRPRFGFHAVLHVHRRITSATVHTYQSIRIGGGSLDRYAFGPG